MLVNNVDGERRVASMVKDSGFYIDLAKFVQAYSMIVLNPNDFLKEIGEPEIDAENDFLTWNQFVKIMQTCDLGFTQPLSETDLVVFYNYALEMGSLGDGAKKIASVMDVANAQKHYYNFVDESAEKAEMAYLRQQQISESRDREASAIGNKLSSLRIKNITCLIFMVVGVLIFSFGLLSLFWENVVASTLGAFMKSGKSIAGGVIFMVLGVVLFAILNNFYMKTRYAFLKLRDASQTIFERSDSAFNDTLVLKDKMNGLKEDLKVVKDELGDKNKKKDVLKNIEELVESNKYYKMFAGNEIIFEKSMKPKRSAPEQLVNVNLSKDEQENLRTVSKEAINMVVTFDEEAYNEKFEQSRKKGEKAEEKEEEMDMKEPEEDTTKVLNEDENKNLQEIQKDQIEQQNKEEQDVDYIKDILGLG